MTSFQQNSFFNPDPVAFGQAAEGKPTPPKAGATIDHKKQHNEWADRVQDIITSIEQDDKVTVIIDALLHLHEDIRDA